MPQCDAVAFHWPQCSLRGLGVPEAALHLFAEAHLWSSCLLNRRDDATEIGGGRPFPRLLRFWFRLIPCRALVPVTHTAYNRSPGCPLAAPQAVCYCHCAVCAVACTPAAGVAEVAPQFDKCFANNQATGLIQSDMRGALWCVNRPKRRRAHHWIQALDPMMGLVLISCRLLSFILTY